MRIGIFTNRLPYPPIGGIPRFLHELTQALSIFDVETEFILPNLKDSSLEIESVSGQDGIEDALAVNASLVEDIALVQDIIVNFQNHVGDEVNSSQKFHSLYLNKDRTFDLVNGFDALIIAGSALLICNEQNFIESISSISIPKILFIPFPLCEIEFYYGLKIKKYVASCIETWSKYCSCIVVPSEYSKNELLSNCQTRILIHKIPLSINLQDFYSDNSQNNKISSRSVISVSRFSHFSAHKNIDCLLDAWSIVKSRVPEATLTLIGAIPSKTRFNKTLLNQDGITVTGKISDYKRNEILKNGRVFVLPSTIEAFGFSFLESIASGIPAIGMNSTATPEIVINAKNGILLEPKIVLSQLTKNEPITHLKPDRDELASAIIHILTDESLYAGLCQGCSANINVYDHSRFAENYISLINSLLGEKGGWRIDSE